MSLKQYYEFYMLQLPWQPCNLHRFLSLLKSPEVTKNIYLLKTKGKILLLLVTL